MKIRSDSFRDGGPIPERCAFGVPDPDTHVRLGDNRNPHLAWDEVPEGTRSFVLTCIDVDVPTRPDDVNQEGREVPADLPRTEFVHWLVANIPAGLREIAEGACSDGVTPRGKQNPGGIPGAVQGQNDYTAWFAGDLDMAGRYLGYDGPCPPWNDALVHRYRFEIVALDVPSLPLSQGFTLAELRQAMAGHELARAALTGTYTLNPRLR